MPPSSAPSWKSCRRRERNCLFPPQLLSLFTSSCLQMVTLSLSHPSTHPLPPLQNCSVNSGWVAHVPCQHCSSSSGKGVPQDMFSAPHPALNVSDKAFPEYNMASNWVYLFGFNTPGLILWKASNTQSVCERKLIKPIEATSCCHHLWDFSPGYRGHDPSLGKQFISCAPDNFCSAGLVP